jgi:hypothetical protein
MFVDWPVRQEVVVMRWEVMQEVVVMRCEELRMPKRIESNC